MFLKNTTNFTGANWNLIQSPRAGTNIYNHSCKTKRIRHVSQKKGGLELDPVSALETHLDL